MAVVSKENKNPNTSTVATLIHSKAHEEAKYPAADRGSVTSDGTKKTGSHFANKAAPGCKCEKAVAAMEGGMTNKHVRRDPQPAKLLGKDRWIHWKNVWNVQSNKNKIPAETNGNVVTRPTIDEEDDNNDDDEGETPSFVVLCQSVVFVFVFIGDGGGGAVLILEVVGSVCCCFVVVDCIAGLCDTQPRRLQLGRNIHNNEEEEKEDNGRWNSCSCRKDCL